MAFFVHSVIVFYLIKAKRKGFFRIGIRSFGKKDLSLILKEETIYIYSNTTTQQNKRQKAIFIYGSPDSN